MAVLDELEAFTKAVLGKLVVRATALLPQTTDEAIFTITGGRVMVTSIIGEVTTVIETQANNTKLKFNPTAAGADTDLCAVLSITADAVGTLYSITGDHSDAMKDGLLTLETDALLERGIILSPGDIELDCAASNTGSVKWSLRFVPIDTGASIEKA